MLAQSLIVAVVVAACSVYAAWSLMPASARRATAAALLKMPLPGGISAFMRRHSLAASGCACDGCDHAADKKAAAPSVQAIHFHPRHPRPQGSQGSAGARPIDLSPRPLGSGKWTVSAAPGNVRTEMAPSARSRSTTS